MTILEKRQKLIEYQAKLVELDTKATTENRELTNDEQKDFDLILNESDSLRKEIIADEERAAKLGNLKKYIEKPISEPKSHGIDQAIPDVNKSEARSIAEWLYDKKYKDEREAVEERTMSMGNGVNGGILIQDQFKPEILSLKPENMIVRPRATIIEAGTPPDAKITIPMFNQSGSKGVYGGLDFQFIDEGGAKSETEVEFDLVELEPKELGGSTICTDKLLRNYPAMTSWLRKQYNMRVDAKEDYMFLRGDGIGKPRGILGCAAEKTVIRSTASTIGFTDVQNMLMALKSDSWGNAVWIANQSTLAQFTGLVDGAGNTLFLVGDATKNIPATLFGIPIIFSGRTPTLGNKGDLMLADFSYYIIKEGSGPYFASSEHVYFTTNKTVIKMFKLVDGAPWVQSPLLLEDGTTTVSPFVILI